MAGTPIGRILLMPKGDYNASVVYDALDWVRHAGSAWVCTTDNTVGVTPAAGVPEWQLLASDGSIGGWASLTGKPFETLGDGVKKAADDSLTLNIDSSLLLGSKLSVNTQSTYSSVGTNPINGTGVADALSPILDGVSIDSFADVESALSGKQDSDIITTVTQANGAATFDDLEPNLSYYIEYNTVDANGVDAVDAAGQDHIDIPAYTKISKTAGTSSTVGHPLIKLVYTIVGGTDGETRFNLRAEK